MKDENAWITVFFLWRKMWKNCGYVEKFIILSKTVLYKYVKT